MATIRHVHVVVAKRDCCELCDTAEQTLSLIAKYHLRLELCHDAWLGSTMVVESEATMKRQCVKMVQDLHMVFAFIEHRSIGVVNLQQYILLIR